jgi:hypothetical protein
MRVSGISRGVKTLISRHCPEVCFTDLRSLPPDSPLAGPQRLWIEARAETIPLADDVDAAIWVEDVHPPHLRLLLLLVLSGKHYIRPAVGIVALILVLLLWLAFRWSRRKQPGI